MADMSAFEQLSSLMQEQKNRIHALNETLKEVDVATGSGGVGEWIEPGTQYTPIPNGSTYTAATNAEIFNNYETVSSSDKRNEAAGSYSHAEGSSTGAYGNCAHAEGSGSIAIGNLSHAEGEHTIAVGIGAHAEGYGTIDSQDPSNNKGAYANYSHTEGYDNDIPYAGIGSHAEGYGNVVKGSFSHAEGYENVVDYDVLGGHVEGYRCVVEDRTSTGSTTLAPHAEGYQTKVYSMASHAEGYDNIINQTSPFSHVEGHSNRANGVGMSHIEGHQNNDWGNGNHIEGYYCTGDDSTSWNHIEGYSCSTRMNNPSGYVVYCHVEGRDNHAEAGCVSCHLEGEQHNAYDSVSTHLEGKGCRATTSCTDPDDSSVTLTGTGKYMHAEGENCTVIGQASHAEGASAYATGFCSHAEGRSTYAIGEASHAEGYGTKARGTYSHAEGFNCRADGAYSHAEGYSVPGANMAGAKADYSHTEGYNNNILATGNSSHAEGKNNVVHGTNSHAEGENNIINASNVNASHVEGYGCKIDYAVSLTTGAHAEGYQTEVYATGSHAEGFGNIINHTATFSHAEGYQCNVSGQFSHVEGNSNKIWGLGNHLEGYSNEDESRSSWCHMEGNDNSLYTHEFSNTYTRITEQPDPWDPTQYYKLVNRAYVHGEPGDGWGLIDWYTIATLVTRCNENHMEGHGNTINDSSYCHIEGYMNTASGANIAHLEGKYCSAGIWDNPPGTGYYTTQIFHAEGDGSSSQGNASHAQNYGTTAFGDYSTSCGHSTYANGESSIATGHGSTATGAQSFTMGYYTIANGDNQLVIGKYNKDNDPNTSNYPFIIGNGTSISSANRSDALKVDWDGKIYVGADTDGVNLKTFHDSFNVTSSDNNKVLKASYSNGVGTYSWQDAPGGSDCIVHTYANTSLPAKVVLEDNNEYRYINLLNATGVTVSIENIDTSKSFYSTIVLHNVNSSDILSNFVTVSNDSVIDNIIFLNEINVDLVNSDTVELLFFANGMANVIMCIGYAYASPIPSYDESKILVIELDTNHQDTSSITEHSTLASAKSQLDTNYSADSSKMYKLFVGDDVFNPAIAINNSVFEDTSNLYSVDLGECITSLYGGVFYDCANLTTMSLPYSMTSTVGYNFIGTNLPSLTLHCNYLRMSGMTDFIFYSNNLTNLTIDATGVVYLANDGQGNDDSYADDGVFGSATYLDGTQNKPITVTFGNNVTGIVANSNGNVFGYNTGGVTVNIPNSVTSINNSFLAGVDQLGGNIVVNIDNVSGAISGAPWGAGSASNLTINYLRNS